MPHLVDFVGLALAVAASGSWAIIAFADAPLPAKTRNKCLDARLVRGVWVVR